MSETEFKVGDLIENRYLVLSVVGAGGMGTLYRVADQSSSGTVMALKTVRLDIPAGEKVGRIESFQREFRLLTQVHHPNLVQVYSFGVIGKENLYYTMEWIEGENLETRIGHLETEAVVPIIIQICRALAYLHARQVIHGDLKPGNVLMAGEQVKIVDFGVALEVTDVQNRERFYTPGYTAPELQQMQRVDHRADLYSLGAVWYALVVGEPPLFMPDPGVERLIRLRLDEALQTHQGEAAQAVSGVIAQLLTPLPEKRYASANEVIAALNEATGAAYVLETPETASSYALRSQFVGRQAEMAQLRQAWEQALRVEGKMVLIGGESGVGKTRLMEEFVVQVQLRGARAAWGQCVESGGNAYQPWREILRVLIRYVEEKNELKMQQIGPVLATLLPELWLRPYMTGLGPPEPLEPTAAQQRLHKAIIQLVRAAAAERPTVIVIEDAHWADEATLSMLGFLRRDVGPAWLMACVTYREEEIDLEHPLALLTGKRVMRIRLPNLSSQETSQLVRSMLGLKALPGYLGDRVQQTTGGNAFFVQELIRSWVESGEVLQRTLTGWRVDRPALERAGLTESIQQVVWQRLNHLSPQAQALLKCAALIGPVFWDGIIQKICRASKLQVQSVLQEILEKELVFERKSSTFSGEREYMFEKPAVREVSYHRVSAQERDRYHIWIAEWLLSHSDEQVSQHLGLVADHLEKAGQTEQAIHYLYRAGEQAAAQFANFEAVAYLSRALDLTEEDDIATRYDLLLARERIYDLQGNRKAQRQDLAVLEKLAEAMDDDRQRAQVSLRQANYALMVGDYPTAVTTAQAGLALVQAIGEVRGQAIAHFRWGRALWYQGNYDEARTQLRQALALAAEWPQVKADSLRDLGTVAYLQGDYAEARNYYQQSLHLYRQIDHWRGESASLNNLGNVLVDLGDYAGAQVYYEQALRSYREIGDRQGESFGLGNLAMLFHHLADGEKTLEYGRQALRIAEDLGDRSTQGYLLTYLGHALVQLDRLTEAADLYQQALALRRELDQSNMATEPLAGLARVSQAQGKLAQAQTFVEEILDHLEQGSLDGTEEPFRVYLTCYGVLRANQDPRAEEILGTAHSLLQARVARISDEAMRHSFLENVAAHREIKAEWAKGGQP